MLTIIDIVFSSSLMSSQMLFVILYTKLYSPLKQYLVAWKHFCDIRLVRDIHEQNMLLNNMTV